MEGLLAVVEHGTPERHFIVEESVAFRSKPEWGAKIPGLQRLDPAVVWPSQSNIGDCICFDIGGVRDGDLVRMISGCVTSHKCLPTRTLYLFSLILLGRHAEIQV